MYFSSVVPHSLTVLSWLTALSHTQSLPIVDLGVTIHQASFNVRQSANREKSKLTRIQETGQYFNFSNIPYAQPPVGDLRFKRSVPLVTPDRVVNDGSVTRICPQARPQWMLTSTPPIPLPPGAPPPAAAPPGPPPGFVPGPDPRESEDCLLLDVFVPQSVFEAAQNPVAPQLAPVVVWIHGGGFALGTKSDQGNPAGLLAQSVANGRTGMIFVQINYRL